MKFPCYLSLLAALLAAPVWPHGSTADKPSKPHHPQAAEQELFGREGDRAKVSRTIEVTMSDQMRYQPDRITVRQGETIRLVIINSGRIMHELVLGSEAELKAHAEVMRKFPNMEHEAPHMAHVAPSQRQEIVWEFNRPGEFLFGCLIPGHFEAGMVGRISVMPSRS
ncbi:cupredoxin domain-containing protein [Chitinimonas lacunae]|uniref:Plastocyanin/azurin family copper-binding protein n=1 Tax=Chitinimonas lacunae TaxID=1963018 RepID=A0ABV8MSX6_9NEIS